MSSNSDGGKDGGGGGNSVIVIYDGHGRPPVLPHPVVEGLEGPIAREGEKPAALDRTVVDKIDMYRSRNKYSGMCSC